jgi:hypothetical protein
MFLLEAFGRSFWMTAIGAFLAVSVAGTAFTASITVPGTNTASGATVIGGYSIGNITYTLNGSNPLNIDAIVFDILTTGSPVAPKVGGVKARALDAGSWYNCTFTGTGPWAATCASTSPQLTVSAAANLTVVVTQ